jgi:hypothetical protein
LYSSPNIRQIKSRHIGWAGYVEFIGCVIEARRAMVEKSEGNDHFEDILKWILKKYGMRMQLYSSCP